MNYSLAEDGDALEKQSWAALKERWPNYEVLWQQFIVPATMRVHNRTDVMLRPGTDQRLEEMCMAHYSVFYHLAHAHQLVGQHGRKTKLPHHYDDMFFHMSAATEMVERFLLALRHIQCAVEGLWPAAPLPEEEIVQKAKAFYEKQYHIDYNRLLQQGRSVSIVLHTLRSVIKPVVVASKTEDIAAKLWRTADRIREYRNVLAHNPLAPMLIARQGVFYLPKPSKLKQYDLWSEALFGEDVEADYIAGATFVRELLEEFESGLNELWGNLIALLAKWRETEEYAALALPADDSATIGALRPAVDPRAIFGSPPSGGSPITYSGTASVSDMDDWPDGGG
jgi:hypothetical protein